MVFNFYYFLNNKKYKNIIKKIKKIDEKHKTSGTILVLIYVALTLGIFYALLT